VCSSEKRDVAQSKKRTLRSLLFTGIVLGIGIAAFLDETLLHQLLQWHAFYWYTDQHGRLLSDGLFHAFSTLLLLWGAFRLWQDRDAWDLSQRNPIFAAVLMGIGGFNLYDGIVQHLILRLHLVNELVCRSPMSQQHTFLGICMNDIPYEIVFDLIALVILSVGVFWWRRSMHMREQ